MAKSVIIPLKAIFDDKGIKDAQKSFGRLGNSLKGALGAVGIGIGLAAITNQLKQASKAAVEDAKSQGLLAQQLKNTVGATDQAIAANEAFISSLELSTSIADDALRPALASLVRATGDVGKAQQLLSISTDVAAGTGRDLGSVAIAVGRAANGQTTALRRLGIVVREGEDPIKALTAAFAGNAEAAANLDPFQRLQVIFGRIQEQVGVALVPTLQNFANFLASEEGQGKIKEFVDATVAALNGLVGFIEFIKANFETLTTLGTIIGTVAIAMGVLNIALNTNPIILAISAVGILVTAFMALNGQLDLLNTGRAKSAEEAGQQAFDASMKSSPKDPIFGSSRNSNQARFIAEAARREAIKQFKIDAQGRGDAARYGALVSQFQSKTGVTFDPFGGSKGVSATKQVIKEVESLTDKAAEALQEFRDSFADLLDFSALTSIAKDVGEFEQSVSDSFDALYKKITEAPEGTIGLAPLRTFLDSQKALLAENARQRDAIIQKRSLAQALIDDVKSSLTGTGNLANLLDTQTRQVTTSITKIIDGFTVTTRQTVDEVIGGQGVVSKLKDVVTKTRAFAKQLTSLKALGLDKNLFKQIVDAGPDVGGQLAKEILDGGTDSVKALNDTFAELESVTADVAEQTAVVMFNAGVEVSGGLVNGLLSQEQALVNAAKTLAQSFVDAFNALMATLKVPEPMTNASGFAYNTGLAGVSGSDREFGAGSAYGQAIAAYRNSGTTQVNNYITVKGSVIKEKELGQLTIASQNKYLKSSGG